MQTLRDVIDHHAESNPDAPFLFAPEPGRTLSYRELRDAARSLASLLQSEGIAPGEVVSFMLPNGVSAATLFLGAIYAGYVVSPLNLVAQDAHLEYSLAHSETRRVFCAPEFVARIERMLANSGRRVRVQATDPDELPLDSSAELEPAPLSASSPALLMYTSGTTGLPKGALLSHRNLMHAGNAVVAGLRLTAADRVLSSLPLYHVNGQCVATVSPIVAGGSIVLPHRFSVSQWWPLVDRYRPTWLNMVPTIISYLLNGKDPTATQAQACRGVRFGRSASAPLPPDQHRAFETRFGISVIEAMGLTECASVAFSNPLDPAQRKYGSPGLPLGVEARVVAPDGRVLDDGERGEIQLRGANVMIGYYKAPDLTRQTLASDGWLATGDVGFRDRDGFYFITGRLKELIIKGGENIAPREIDEALLKHPAVLEAAAVGMPDAAYGQDILACVVLKQGVACTEKDLREHCLRELGRFKTPKVFRIVGELPKGASGKVQRLKLLESPFDAR
jgi:acyl-CoA synthetase (AMP-forming)/AMP-acid ligase II